jgi:SAM-dependent methyltransferase
MTVASISIAQPRSGAAPLFVGTVFASAALVFMVEPMIARLILPRLGGSPAVWNTCVVFFQTSLLIGYLYAHLLKKLRSAKLQVAVHLSLLGVAALCLPIGVTNDFGTPPVGAPLIWLVGVLAVSIGAPFAILSATAPLLQTWYAHELQAEPQARNPYILYSASNLASMLALLSYPSLIEPLLALHVQTFVWTVAYLVFCISMAAVGVLVWQRAPAGPAMPPIVGAISTAAPTWRMRLLWLTLSAVPSSLMLGITTHISDGIASVPFLWVIPLALYLLTFVISFQAEPLISRERALLWHGAFVAAAAGLLCVSTTSLIAHLLTYTLAFFFGALVCHQRLSASRPSVRYLTEFYLLISLGGVLGGMFNAFLAPVIFSTVAEFPLALGLTLLGRPWRLGAISPLSAALAIAGVAAAASIGFVPDTSLFRFAPVFLAVTGATIALVVSGRPVLFALVIGAFCAEAVFSPASQNSTLLTARTFFGIHRVTRGFDPRLGGELHFLFHGTTIHGAQPQAAAQHCVAMTYYAQATPIGQALAGVLARHRPARIGVVGLGAGTVAAYTRPGDRMRFFEIDPEVERIARDRRYFTYLSDCAKGAVDVVLGDARLTLARERTASYDMLLLDAFSADSVPTHLLTVEAIRTYLRVLKPGGIVLLHLSNRNLALEAPAAAAAKDVGAPSLMQEFSPSTENAGVAAPTQAMLMARSEAALAVFRKDPRWRPARDQGVRAWSDDYTNVFGALIARAIER